MTTHTPSPQSVVLVPAKAPFEVGQEIFVRHEVKWATKSENVWPGIGWPEGHTPENCLFVAAPAPSSLAGGEVTNDQIQSVMLAAIKEVRATVTDATEGACMDADIIRMERGLVDMGDTGWAVMRSVHRRLAALSPEAPAREGVEALRTALIKARSELAIQYCYSAGRMGIAGCYPELAEKYGGSAIVQEIDAVLALTPRHEAPAEDDDGPCTCCDDTGITIQTERPCACAAGIPFEAPAEGAGEAMTEREVRQWIDACNHEPARQVLRDYLALRARSSAPEAREEALGNLLAVIHGDGGHRALEVGTKQAALEAEKIVAGLFAAPSADKLWDHLEWIETVLTDPVPGYTARIATAREYIDQALAALKAEGAA